MAFYPTVKALKTQRRMTDAFYGYDRREKIRDGAWHDMKNLTGEAYPLLSVRKRRGKIASLRDPQGLLGRDAAVWIDGTALYIGGADVTGYLTAAGVMLSAEEGVCRKQMVSMGAYVCIFPDKVYVNTQDYTDCGYMEARWEAGEETVVCSLCDGTGGGMTVTWIQDSPPENAENGEWWIDTSVFPHSLRQYSALLGAWTDSVTAYVKLEAPGIGAAFREGDGVEFSGCGGNEQAELLNGIHVLHRRGDDFVVIAGILDTVCSQTGGVRLERQVPEMDFVCQAQNRLWGCRYGLAGGRIVNELYCCKLGDFRNWNVFSGISTDAWTASVGSDGAFTGAVNFLGSPVFFKENVLHRITISPTGGHSVLETACRGVQKGCSRSAVMVGELLLYKSADGVCAYDGALPVLISQALGNETYSDAAAGSFGERYWCAMKDGTGKRHLFVYDTARGFWVREDDLYAAAFARTERELLCVDGNTGELLSLAGTVQETEAPLEWEAVSGRLGYEYPGRKYLARIELRMKKGRDASLRVDVQYDSSGVWEEQRVHMPDGSGVVTVQLRPRRCDHFALRLRGTGEAVIFSLYCVLEGGAV